MAARKTREQVLAEGEVIDRAAREAVREALSRHQRLGESIVVWQGGQVVEVPPDRIEIDDAADSPADAKPTSPEAT